MAALADSKMAARAGSELGITVVDATGRTRKYRFELPKSND